MRVLGFDASLTGFGVADTAAPEPRVLVPPAAVGLGWLRIDWIYKQVMGVCDAVPGGRPTVDLVVREGPAYHSATNAYSSGELWGVIGYALWRRGIPVVPIAPNTLKKLATGVGKGLKAGVLVAAVRRLGYTGASDDAADAMWALEAARQHYDLPGKVALPKSHTETLHKLKWPPLDKLRASA